ESSRLAPPEARDEGQRHLAAWTKQLIALRKRHASLGTGTKGQQIRVWENPAKTVLTVYRRMPGHDPMLLILGFNARPTKLTLSQPKNKWTLILDNGQKEYAPSASPPTSLAPMALDLTSAKQTLSLPAYPAWVFKQS
ncbi:MAG: DUF3459 domain-containing protein, partial [Nitrospirales bacterium]|nr:DUF3459 domain-containing protein [Nitrospirales bacterium]